MNVLKKIRQRGLYHSIKMIFNRFVPAWVFRFSSGVVLELDMDEMAAMNRDGGESPWQFVCVENADQRDELRRVTWNSVPRAYADKDFGYAVARAADPNQIVGGVWVGVKDFLEADLGFEIAFGDDQAWLYCAFINPDARGGGIYKRLLGFVGQNVKERGFGQFLVMIQPWNKASMYVHRKYSSREIGGVTVLRIFNMSWVRCSGAVDQDKCRARFGAGEPVKLTIGK